MYFEEGLAVGWASVCDGRLLYFFYTLARALLFTLLMLSNSHARQLAQKLNFLRVMCRLHTLCEGNNT